VTSPCLYSYWRSTAAYRVRIALNLKGIACRIEPVHLVRDGGEQRRPGYLALNPQGLVPTYVDGDVTISQSLAICEYLEETQPEPALLPVAAADRARVRSLAQIVACDVHPLNNLRVLNYLTGELGVDERGRTAWYRHWVACAFDALEISLAGDARTGAFCHGDRPGLADLCLVPQVYNAERFDCDMAPYPTVRRINASCLSHDAFRTAAPEAQPDAA
jgi:maleylacetoacetate isomerase